MLTFPLENVDYFIKYVELPPGIYAFLHLNSDGTYVIVLDPRRSFDQQLDDWEHELWHIIRDDFYNGKPISEVENL